MLRRPASAPADEVVSGRLRRLPSVDELSDGSEAGHPATPEAAPVGDGKGNSGGKGGSRSADRRSRSVTRQGAGGGAGGGGAGGGGKGSFTVGGSASSGLQQTAGGGVRVVARSRSPPRDYVAGWEDGYLKGRGKGDAAFDEGFAKGKAKGRAMDGDAVSGLLAAASALSVSAMSLNVQMTQRRHQQ